MDHDGPLSIAVAQCRDLQSSNVLTADSVTCSRQQARARLADRLNLSDDRGTWLACAVLCTPELGVLPC